MAIIDLLGVVNFRTVVSMKNGFIYVIWCI